MSRYNNRILDSIGTEVSNPAFSDTSESKSFLNKSLIQNMPDIQSGGFMNFLFGSNEPRVDENQRSVENMPGYMSRNIRAIPVPGALMEALKNARNNGYGAFNQMINKTPIDAIDVNYVNDNKENIMHVLVDSIADLENKIQRNMHSYNSDSMTLENMKNILDRLIAKNRDAINAPDRAGTTPFLKAVKNAEHTPAMSQIVGYMKSMGANVSGIFEGRPYIIQEYTDYDNTMQPSNGIFKRNVPNVRIDGNQKPIFTPQSSITTNHMDTEKFVRNWGARPGNYTETIGDLRTDASNAFRGTMNRVSKRANNANVDMSNRFNNFNQRIQSPEQLFKKAKQETDLIQKEADNQIKQISENAESKKRIVMDRLRMMSEDAQRRFSAFDDKRSEYTQDLQERTPYNPLQTQSNTNVDDTALVNAMVTKIIGEQQSNIKGGKGKKKKATKNKGVRKMITFSDVLRDDGNSMFGGDSDENRIDDTMKNISRAAANQKDKLHTEAVEKILAHLPKKDELLAKTVKALIYDEIKQAKPELSGLDKAAEMMKAISKKKVDDMLKKTDLINKVSKKINERNERNKSKGDVDSDAVAKITKKIGNKESGRSKYDDEFESSVSITSDYDSSDISSDDSSIRSPVLHKKKKNKTVKRR
jgi:hypothetical protein